jgi:hypothetical protein
MSNLRDLNAQNLPANPMHRHFYEDQRDGPFDGVGYVGRRSDYEREEEYIVDNSDSENVRERYYSQSRQFR